MLTITTGGNLRSAVQPVSKGPYAHQQDKHEHTAQCKPDGGVDIDIYHQMRKIVTTQNLHKQTEDEHRSQTQSHPEKHVSQPGKYDIVTVLDGIAQCEGTYVAE